MNFIAVYVYCVATPLVDGTISSGRRFAGSDVDISVGPSLGCFGKVLILLEVDFRGGGEGVGGQACSGQSSRSEEDSSSIGHRLENTIAFCDRIVGIFNAAIVAIDLKL